MLKYLCLLAVYIVFYLSAMLLAPILPAFAYMQYGWSNNHEEEKVEPRLPKWLNWYMTPDNSLYGDQGWRLQHCPHHWRDYFGQVLWLWRNPAAGFCWSVLGGRIDGDTLFHVKDSGSGLNVDKGQGAFGWFRITASTGLFQCRIVKHLWGEKAWTFDYGWLLDPYVKDDHLYFHQPTALFQFQPQVRTVRNSCRIQASKDRTED